MVCYVERIEFFRSSGMFQKHCVTLFILLLFSASSSSIDFCGIEVTPYGYAAADLFFDTRQVEAPRDGFVLLWPAPVLLDPMKIDINAHGHFGITAIQSRLGLQGVWNWREGTLKGLIEGDFLGITDPSTGAFRLRHAYAEINRPGLSFLAGQYWHPMFVPDCFPETISFANGAPIEALDRDPQIRLTARGADKEFILAFIVGPDYPVLGPIGTTDITRNGLIPEIHAQVRLFPYTDVVIGAGGNYKRIAPHIESEKGFAVHEKIDSACCELYAAYNGKKFQVRTKFIYDQNGASLLLLSGFAVRSINPVTGQQSFANTQAVSAWIDTAYWFHNETVSVGGFLGYTKALGSSHRLYIDKTTKQPVVFALDPTLAYLGRFAPRIRYKTNLFQFGAELDITWSAYGRLNNRAQVVHAVPTAVYRILLEALYFF